MIGRIVCAGDVPRSRRGVARKAIERATPALNSFGVRGIVTPGGFAHFTIPGSYRKSRGWNTKTSDFEFIAKRTTEHYRNHIQPNRFIFGNTVRYLTIGIDPYDSYWKLAELVLIHDIRENRVHVTGKSFPRTDEEDELVLAPVDSHFITIGSDHLMILGRMVRRHIKQIARGFEPNVVLHHAHATDSEKTWAAGWSGLLKDLRSVKNYTTALGFYNAYTRNKVRGSRSPFEVVQKAYHSEDVRDSVLVF